MGYNAAAVRALEAADHHDRCFADEVRRGFGVRKDLGMLEAVVGRGPVLEGRGESEVMGLSTRGKFQKAGQQAGNIVVTQDVTRAPRRTSCGETEPIVVVSGHAYYMRLADSGLDDGV